jgi:hypothetical protein
MARTMALCIVQRVLLLDVASSSIEDGFSTSIHALLKPQGVQAIASHHKHGKNILIGRPRYPKSEFQVCLA